MKKFHCFAGSLLFVAAGLFASCTEDDESATSTKYGIPNDEYAAQNPTVDGSNTNIPNIQYTVEMDGDDAIVRIDMTGVQDAETLEWLRLAGTNQEGQNVWLSIDGKPKGIVVYNNSDSEEKQALLADLVFVVDNSGSMSEEADAVARDIKAWAAKLESSNLDIRFGCVGYDGEITGAINLTDAATLSAYLERSSGTYRTVGFYGDDANTLASSASDYYNGWNECGGAALRYADHNMDFRTGANRIYVNFTDEPNQPRGQEAYSVNFFADQKNWNANQGTVHTVFSEDSTYYTYSWQVLYDERPWLISDYTGGTKIFASSSFEGVTLESLPVTGAMTNSYVIRFTNVREYLDGNYHEVKITILSADGKTRAEKTFSVKFDVTE